jgi:hypothetical protein
VIPDVRNRVAAPDLVADVRDIWGWPNEARGTRTTVCSILIEEYREPECRSLLETAGAEAKALLADAYRRARAQLHERVVSERANARSRLHAARAEHETRLRARGDRANARLLELAWPRLRQVLSRRWADPPIARIWARHAVAQARQRLPVGLWTVRHPPDWAAAEWAPFEARAHQRSGSGTAFQADGALIGRARHRSGGRRAGCEPRRSAARPAAFEARLLALLARHPTHAGVQIMSTAETTWISGPVLRARPDGPFRLRESVTVGDQALLGEVIRIARDEITVQLYEDTSGLRPGIEVTGSGRLLSIRLGPAILSGIFDGLLRPVGDIPIPTSSRACRCKPPGDSASRRACASAIRLARRGDRRGLQRRPASLSAVWCRPICRAGASPRSPMPASTRTTSRSAGSTRPTVDASRSP